MRVWGKLTTQNNNCLSLRQEKETIMMDKSITSTAQPPQENIMLKAAKSAFRGGAAGFLAMILQVLLLMWLRTVLNYQYRHNVSISEAFAQLYAQGGVLRFYQGVSFAFMSGPLSRFGDTASNEGVRAIFAAYPGLGSVEFCTLCASMVAGLWRVLITPLDTLKTSLQVAGKEGWDKTMNKVKANGIISLWDGALGNWSANMVGHYPWFATHNKLDEILPKAETQKQRLLRRAVMGLISGIVSDCISNGLRVMKTFQQTSEVSITYFQAFTMLLEESGPKFIFRGLGTKLFGNALSSILFSILWKMILNRLEQSSGKSDSSNKDGATKTDDSTRNTQDKVKDKKDR